jgi:hypothetical protein
LRVLRQVFEGKAVVGWGGAGHGIGFREYCLRTLAWIIHASAYGRT